MSRVYIEQRTRPNTRMNVLAADLVYHFYVRMPEGKLVVIAKEPFLLLRVVRKHWLRLERTVYRERAKTLDSHRIAELSKRLAMMRQFEFTARPPKEAPHGNIFFLEESQIETITTDIATAYVAMPLAEEAFAQLCQKIKQKGLVVTYVD